MDQKPVRKSRLHFLTYVELIPQNETYTVKKVNALLS